MRRLRGFVVVAGMAALAVPAGTAALAVPAGTASAVVQAQSPQITLAPASVVGVGTEVTFGLAVEGNGWFGHDQLQINSPGLTAACADGANLGWISTGTNAATTGTANVLTDKDGTFNAALVTANCPAGNYEITAVEVSSPNRVATAAVAVTTEPTGGPALTLAPTQEVETLAGHAVTTTLVLEGLAPGETVDVGSARMVNTCSSVSALALTSGAGTVTLPATVAADADGQVALAILATHCLKGTDTFKLREVGTAVHHASVAFTIS